MKSMLISAAIAAIAAAPAIAAKDQQVAAPEQAVEASDPVAAAIVADCSARKFETTVELEKDGAKRLTKLKLCAAKGSDEAGWVRTLADAKAKIAAHPTISAESKSKIAAEFDAEIARVRTAGAASPALPGPPPELPTAASVPAMSPSTVAPIASPPRLTILCLAAGGPTKSAPCTLLQRTTQLSVQADANLVPGTRLRFLRRGDVRGEIALGAMRQGQLIRRNLPPQLCSGVASSKVEIQVMGLTGLIETLGPFQLRC